ncbi:MAG: PaeR7I family type II restriction endonuclease [Bacteroidia bacterium]|nr:PaeR7I family type II restriction endonuclease [Bacteroidia bacterium]
MDGFVRVLKQAAVDLGVPEACIYTRGNSLPGFFRPSKAWDFLIITPGQKLIAAAELKSQVGSFGNNFNNRVEEAIGSAVDLWTAFRERTLPQMQQPWLGYWMLVEKTPASVRPVQIQAPHFQVRSEFQQTSYLDRYVIFCRKLLAERHYSAAALIWTTEELEFGSLHAELSAEVFLLSLMGFIQGRLQEFEP